MKSELHCVVCRKILRNDLPAFSIFKRDDSQLFQFRTLFVDRSPLREKQNLTASVQRSKSAQTPQSRQKFAENRLMLSSPHHLRGSPRLRHSNKKDQENLPTANRRTPLSAKKQRRQLSERQQTPKELPMVGLALSSPAQPADLARRQSPRINI